MATVNITKSTTFSMGVLLVLAGAVWWASGADAAIKANTQDIQTVFQEIKSLNDNLITTNNNVVRLNQILTDKTK